MVFRVPNVIGATEAFADSDIFSIREAQRTRTAEIGHDTKETAAEVRGPPRRDVRARSGSRGMLGQIIA